MLNYVHNAPTKEPIMTIKSMEPTVAIVLCACSPLLSCAADQCVPAGEL